MGVSAGAGQGLAPELRQHAWPFLLGVYAPGSTAKQRDVVYSELRTAYGDLLKQAQVPSARWGPADTPGAKCGLRWPLRQVVARRAFPLELQGCKVARPTGILASPQAKVSAETHTSSNSGTQRGGNAPGRVHSAAITQADDAGSQSAAGPSTGAEEVLRCIVMDVVRTPGLQCTPPPLQEPQPAGVAHPTARIPFHLFAASSYPL